MKSLNEYTEYEIFNNLQNDKDEVENAFNDYLEYINKDVIYTAHDLMQDVMHYLSNLKTDSEACVYYYSEYEKDDDFVCELLEKVQKLFYKEDYNNVEAMKEAFKMWIDKRDSLFN